jgi:hypothetical protein
MVGVACLAHVPVRNRLDPTLLRMWHAARKKTAVIRSMLRTTVALFGHDVGCPILHKVAGDMAFPMLLLV